MSALDLFIEPARAEEIEVTGWRLQSAHDGAGYERGYADGDFDDSPWEPVRLPHIRHATAEQDTLWYRAHFPSPARSQGQRWLLRLGGAFYLTRVWLNGADLGNHEGYFQPFGFDITDLLQPDGNVVAVRCRFPVEAGSFKRKTAVAGVFTDWDCKPYPSTFYPHLPEPNAWTVPVGLWKPVCLLASGPALVESFNVYPTSVDADWGSGRARRALIKYDVRLRNLTDRPLPVNLRAGVKDNASISAPSALQLGPGEGRRVHLETEAKDLQLWFPWTHGEPKLYIGCLGVDSGGPTRGYEQTFGVRDIQADFGDGRWGWQLNGRPIFPRGSNYISDFYLDRVTPEGLTRDLDLAVNANLDLLRVHAHIAPPEFYGKCDATGLMVMCDFPLIWTYGYNLSPQADTVFRATVERQASDMVDLLGSRPSIILWSMHNEPPWTPDGSFLGSDVHESQTNRDLDTRSAELVASKDPTRPVIPASGVYDQHLYHGWYTGSWTDNRTIRPTFPTEFGVQALPSAESPFWATVNTAWPVDAEDPSWAHSGYQSIFWASPGVGAPGQYGSLAEYARESQAYQAFYIRRVIDAWRRQKFAPTSGYIHFLFTDGWPAITWSVLDYFRLPKAGYAALAEASRPVHVCLDLIGPFSTERGFHLRANEGAQIELDLWMVNDDYRQAGDVMVTYWVQPMGKGLRAVLRRAMAQARAERLNVMLPRADAGAQHIETVHLRALPSGDYSFVVQTRQAGRILDENTVDFRVGQPRTHSRPARRVPGVLINRVYVAGSLRHTADGITFSLRNPAMPVSLVRLGSLVIDGQPVDPGQVEFLQTATSRPAATVSAESPLAIASGATCVVIVHSVTLVPGHHEFGLTAEFAGLGEVEARLKDRLI